MVPITVKITGTKVAVADAISHLDQLRPVHLFNKTESDNLQGVAPKGVVMDIVFEDKCWLAVIDVGRDFSTEGKIFELFADNNSGFKRISLLMSAVA